MPLFATCTGRLSAMMEFQWLIQDAHSDETEMQRDNLADILAAVTPAGAESQAMALRVQAKEAQRQILMLTLQTHDPAQSAWAKRRADSLMAECQALVVS